MSGTIRYHVTLDGEDYEADVDVPQGPLCSRCGHELCPCCVDWCDVVDEVGGVCDCFELGGCVVDEAARATWVVENERRRLLACFGLEDD